MGAVANEFVFGFCSFPGGENSFGKLLVVFVWLPWPRALLETKENNEKRAGALPLAQRTSPGQVVPCLDVAKTVVKPGRALRSGLKQKQNKSFPQNDRKPK